MLLHMHAGGLSLAAGLGAGADPLYARPAAGALGALLEEAVLAQVCDVG